MKYLILVLTTLMFAGCITDPRGMAQEAEESLTIVEKERGFVSALIFGAKRETRIESIGDVGGALVNCADLTKDCTVIANPSQIEPAR